jgi:hypothetical protein
LTDSTGNILISLIEKELSLLKDQRHISNMSVQFFGSQIGGETERPLSYTGSPWRLFISDILLFMRWSFDLVNIVLPLWPWPSGDLDELYPSLANNFDIVLHSVLFVTQTGFLISLPAWATFPFFLCVAYVVAFMALNTAVCMLLNGQIPEGGLPSTVDNQSRAWARHDDETWLFLNGVAVGYVLLYPAFYFMLLCG